MPKQQPRLLIDIAPCKAQLGALAASNIPGWPLLLCAAMARAKWMLELGNEIKAGFSSVRLGGAALKVKIAEHQGVGMHEVEFTCSEGPWGNELALERPEDMHPDSRNQVDQPLDPQGVLEMVDKLYRRRDKLKASKNEVIAYAALRSCDRPGAPVDVGIYVEALKLALQNMGSVVASDQAQMPFGDWVNQSYSHARDVWRAAEGEMQAVGNA